MKHIAIASLLLIASLVRAELHEFKTPDGKSVNAEIVGFRNGQVELKREGGKCVNVKPSIFVEEDQQYIREWSASQSFLSEKLMLIKCNDTVVEEWKKEKWQDVRYTGGVVEREQMKVTTFERMAYEVGFQNRSKELIDAFRMEYVIYYEQSKESWDTPVVEQKTFFGRMNVSALPEKQEALITTDSIILHKDNINSMSWVSDRSKTGGKGDIHGIRGRLYMKTASGREVVREFSHPESLSEEEFPWTTRTTSASKKKRGKG